MIQIRYHLITFSPVPSCAPPDDCLENAGSKVLARFLVDASLATAVPLATPTLAPPTAVPLAPPIDPREIFGFRTSGVTRGEGVVVRLSRALSLAEEGRLVLKNGEEGTARCCCLLEMLLLGNEPADLDGEGGPLAASEGRRSLDGKAEEEDRAGVRLTRPEGNLGGPGDCAEGNRVEPGDCAKGNLGEPGDCAESHSGTCHVRDPTSHGHHMVK